ncbi:Dihydrodipicolinate reductase [Rickettsiales bacterium Ac37b]|nr:Dihydrodipicolinate reductase [Rickettsiales bacterium Ac37b]
MIKVGVAGCTGRMGIYVMKAVLDNDKLSLAGATTRANNPYIGEDVGMLVSTNPIGIKIDNDYEALCQNSDVIIDFTTPEASLHLSNINSYYKKSHIIGTTGFIVEQKKLLLEYARNNVLVISANMSIGINLLSKLIRQAVKSLPVNDFDIEIIEKHHRNKKDAPSGTALLLGSVIAETQGVNLSEKVVLNRLGDIKRKNGEIGFSVVRGGDIIGEHTVLFAGIGEQIEIVHKATDRSIFAKGAIRAALWSVNQAPGLYSMEDVLG